jgi:outer membrane receptor protein involved in Fe transport
VRDDGPRGRLQLFFNVNNLFDTAPQRAPSENGASNQLADATLYDVRGRYFTGGIRMRF